VQTVYEGILRRNRMPSAYNPRRGSISNYVTWVGRCQMSNLIEVSRRHPLVTGMEPMDEDAEASHWLH